MRNPRMLELASEVMEKVRACFPEVNFLRYRNNPENENSIFIEVTAPFDEDRELELSEFVSEIGSDIALEYGFMIFVLPQHHHTTSQTPSHLSNS